MTLYGGKTKDKVRMCKIIKRFYTYEIILNNIMLTFSLQVSAATRNVVVKHDGTVSQNNAQTLLRSYKNGNSLM